MVLGQLFKLHPDFDDSVFRILSSSPDDSFIVLVRERNAALNSMLAARWRALQLDLCCAAQGNEEGEKGGSLFPSCCTHMSLHGRMHHRRHQEMLGQPLWHADDSVEVIGPEGGEGDDGLYAQFLQHLTQDGGRPYVLHRIRFIDYASYHDALLEARVVMDTFPYGGVHVQTRVRCSSGLLTV